ncbi:MAG: FeoB-associated Cys-rich membrane protein [Clostridia bacterium]|nr:FeoB-associated Cys-rich membrane protein [Clostridia bacterium]
MLQWLSANLGTILVCVVLAFIVAGVIRSLIKDKRKGKSACGNNCAHCAMAGKCHPSQNTQGGK